MKRTEGLSVLIFLLVLVSTFTGCKKDPVMPTLSTTAVSNVAITTATSGGSITSDGAAEVIARGVCWGTTTGPTVSGSHTSDGIGTGNFTSSLTGLSANTQYFVRAYATNSVGTGYGSEFSFTTNPVVGATLTTTAVAVGTITATTAVSGGNIQADGGGAITARGVCWKDATGPTIADTHTTDGTGTGTFTSNLTNLDPGTTYYVKAYATNNSGTTYGNEVSFKTLAVVPTVTTAAITVFTQTTATMGGAVTNNGGAAVTERGVCWGSTANPTIAGTHLAIGSGDGAFSANITSLAAGTTYHVRAYAINTAGPAYGDDVTFTTSAITAPILTTTAVTSITSTTAISGGTISSAGGGTILDKGVCYGTTTNPTISGPHTTNGTGTASFTSNLSVLTAGEVYYVRAYATNELTTTYGSQMTFVTHLTDIEGNNYRTVIIGTQVWMAENLKTTKYNDDTDIPLVTGNTDWMALTTPAYCWYFNNEALYKNVYGALYNWYTVSTGILCPTGWHVPTDTEFKTLEMFLGMSQTDADSPYSRGTNQGAQMKTVDGWNPVNTGTNTSGFSVLPGGYRYYVDGQFYDLGTTGSFRTSGEHSATTAIYRQFKNDLSTVFRQDVDKKAGFSIRCLKN